MCFVRKSCNHPACIGVPNKEGKADGYHSGTFPQTPNLQLKPWPQAPRQPQSLNTPINVKSHSPGSPTNKSTQITSPDELRPLTPEAEAGGADKVGILGRGYGIGGEGRRVDEAPPEKELHQRHPLRPRVRYIYGCRTASCDSMTPS